MNSRWQTKQLFEQILFQSFILTWKALLEFNIEKEYSLSTTFYPPEISFTNYFATAIINYFEIAINFDHTDTQALLVPLR